jgi:hypothetical protein
LFVRNAVVRKSAAATLERPGWAACSRRLKSSWTGLSRSSD